MSVTKIAVKYGRTVAGPKDYESRRADAEIGVQLEEGDPNIDLELDGAMSYAMSVVHTTLGIGAAKEAKSPARGNISDNPEDRKDPEAEEELTPAQKSARTRKANKVAKEAQKALDEEAAAEDARIDALDGNQEDAGDVEPDDDADLINMDDPVETPAELPEDDGEDFDEISDSELGAVINKKAKALKAAGRADGVEVVKAAIASFNTEDKDNWTAGMMTQAQRRKFVVKLGAIKAEE